MFSFLSPTYPRFQSDLLRFHEAIKLKNSAENLTLREKRDAVLRRMWDKGLRFDWFNQGSYAMGTGVLPLDGDYDIDIGVVFSGSPDERPNDPREVKRWVRDAVAGHTSVPAQWMRHCVRVQYVKSGNAIYHVDLAVYWQEVTTNWRGEWVAGDRYLAVGKEHSGPSQIEWQRAEPEQLRDLIAKKGEGQDGAQLRRVIRYLKRWKDLNFPSQGNASPVGIGLSVAALEAFEPQRPFGAQTPAQYDDFKALRHAVEWMRARFDHVIENQAYVNRLVVPLPVEPGLDVFRKMTGQQMKEFKVRLDTLASLLTRADQTGELGYLVEAFGQNLA